MNFMKYLHPLWKTRLTKDSNPHSVVLSALDDMLHSVAIDAMDSKTDARLETATGYWLDEFGDKFGVFRKDNEDDDTYRQRIINYILIERGTILSIEDAIKKYINDPTTQVSIYEPYKNVFILNKSKLNGEDHLLGKYYTTAVIDAKFTENVPLDVINEINKFKPAGVKALMTREPNRQNDDAPILTYTVTDPDVTAKTIALHQDRDRTYLKLSGNGIIGYKRVQKIFLVRPLQTGENVSYPVITYGDKKYCLIPTDKAALENVDMIYIQTTVIGGTFENKPYYKRDICFGITSKDEYVQELEPSSVTSDGTIVASTSFRDNLTQYRGDNLNINEEFIIQIKKSN